jgi:deferrochelatase/peroxidase EfeB
VNPRDDLGDDPMASLQVVARHRLHRRGRVYGETPTDLFVDDGRDRGLVFITVGSSVRRQFEFVQNLWLTSTCFNGLHGEDDPVAGPRAPHYFDEGGQAHGTQTSPFSIPTYPVRRTVHALPRFVTTRGGDYFFLPGTRALRFLAALR